ncbi:Cytochrome c551 peroxidase [Methylobacterium crusticola]|uniref:Cytochrome c551 peroxidase n=1 Tax=Methylobacterium crusticola TaxID=1697972 RepID=A0ABQ4R7Q0_9HYPH|nr:cytochrome c peroxidase [Methylobacterium crusticola]GJD53688.1 Cytochrome c551 peroxidase [Methylobacterium crusticola]
MGAADRCGTGGGGPGARPGRLRRLAAACAALLLAGAAEPAPDLPGPVPMAVPDQEPITPVPLPPAADPAVLALGERLFTDTRLSADGSRSCATCHDPRTNGADARRRSPALDGTASPFNTISVFNAALSYRLSWEGQFRTLEEQAASSIESRTALGARIGDVVDRLRADAALSRQFRGAFGRDPDRAALVGALATYERSLLTPDGRFDRWLRGDAGALTAEERQGYRDFKALGCVSCHQGANVGSNLLQRHGIFHPLAAEKPEVLRVPSLRNVAATPPYFHDGSAPTLREAVRRMGAAQLNQTLGDEQIDRLVAFLGTLTGRYQGRPVVPAPPDPP